MKAAVGEHKHMDCIALKRGIQGRTGTETKGVTLPLRMAHHRGLVPESPFDALPGVRHARKTGDDNR